MEADLTQPLRAPRLTASAVAAAFAVAALADAVQLLLTAMSLTGFLTLPVEAIDICLDVVVCVGLSVLLGGFHWVLAPAFVAEALPVVDLIPTWTAAVGTLVLIRRAQEKV